MQQHQIALIMKQDAFSTFGQVESVTVASDPITKLSKGYGFVSFLGRQHARMYMLLLPLHTCYILYLGKAIQLCSDGLFLIGPSYRPVRVDEAEFCGYEDLGFDKDTNRVSNEKVRNQKSFY